jgi:DNA-binding XRE family transcriptional regulator
MLPWQECSNCGESTVHFRDLQAFALAVSLVFARRGSVAPDALKYMRKTLGLTAVEFGDLLGLRPETISRIENGRIPADRRTVALLGALVEDEAAGKSATRARLLALRRPKKAAKVVRVAL